MTAILKRFILASTILAGSSHLAFAQSATEATPSEVIVVTAQRRSERLIDVPAAVSAFSGDALRERGVTQLRDVADQISGVQIIRTVTGQPSFIIRGVGLIETNPNNPPPTATYQDDVYQFTTAQAQSGIFDIERIEVLKGPQGGFYGRNTSGGVVRVVSRAPSLTDIEGGLTVSLASFEKLALEGGVSFPIVADKVGVRIAARGEKGGGWQQSLSDNRDHGDAERFAARATIVAQPTEAMNLKLIIDGGRDTSENTLVSALGARALPANGSVSPQFYCPAINAGQLDNNSCLTYAGVLSGLGFSYLPTARPNTQSGDGGTTLSNAFGRSNIKNLGVTFAGRLDLGFGTLVSTTAYRDFIYGRSNDSDGTGAELGHSIATTDMSAFSQEVRFQSKDGNALNWAFGLAYSKEELDEERQFLFRDDPFAVSSFRVYGIAARSQAVARLAYNQESEMLAGFGEASYRFSPQWEVRGSVRYTDLNKSYNNGGFNFPTGTGPIVSIALPITNYQLSNDYEMDQKWTGNLSVNYKPTSNVMVYGSVGSGTKEGGFSGGFPTQGLDSIAAFSEEKVLAYEIGAKARFLNGKTGLNAAAFWYDYTDAQVSLPVRSQLTGAVFGRPGNADAIHKGLELEGFVAPIGGLRIDASVTFLEAKYTDSQFFTTQDGTQVPLDGLTRPLAPEVSWTARAVYDASLGNNGTLSFAVDASGRTDRQKPYVATTGTNREKALGQVDGYTLANARISWRAADDLLTISAFARNLSDEVYVATPGTDGNGSFTELYGDPRTYGIELSTKF